MPPAMLCARWQVRSAACLLWHVAEGRAGLAPLHVVAYRAAPDLAVQLARSALLLSIAPAWQLVPSHMQSAGRKQGDYSLQAPHGVGVC